MPHYIEEMYCLSLTIRGKIKLCAYPEEAIKTATNSIKIAKRNKLKLKDLFAFAVKTCLTYCKKNDIEPNYAFVKRFNDQEGIEPSTPFLTIRDTVTSKPQAQQQWTSDNDPPTPENFDYKVLTDYYKSDEWKKLENNPLGKSLHSFLMRAINEAERRVKS